MNIVLVYAGDPNHSNPRAPYSITYHLYQFLKERANVVYYDWCHTGPIDLPDNAIILGHPNYDHNTVVQRIFREGRPCRARCLIHPFHTRRPEDNLPFDDLVRMCDRHFPICGPYWTDTIAETEFRSWFPKMFRLDMALDTEHFSFRRNHFRPIGKRRLIYCGSSMPQKNLGLMTEMMKRLPDVELHWYGGHLDHPLAKLRNVRTTGWSDLTPGLLDKMVGDCDIFVNTSVSDASPTAMLEGAATGFVVACTPESGIYDNAMVSELSLNDVHHNVNVVRDLLNAPEEHLMDRARAARQEIERTHTWPRFCERLWAELVTL